MNKFINFVLSTYFLAAAFSGCSLVKRDGYKSFNDFRVGVNYYPSGKLWRDFWVLYDRAQVEADFSRMRELDLNLVRVFLHQEIFVDHRTRYSALEALDHLIATAQKNNIQVIITSFDWAKPYHFPVGSVSNDDPFSMGLMDILKRYSMHPSVYAWDLKNEPDHDFKSDGRTLVTRWLSAATQIVKTQYPSVLTTVGWLHIHDDIAVNHESSFLSFHHFPEQGSLDSRIKEFKNLYPKKSLLLEEVGYSTFPDDGQSSVSRPAREREQRLFIFDALHLSVRHGLMGMLIWNLFDHPEDGGPKRVARENYFGILSKAGVAKTAAKALESGIYPNSCGEAAPDKDGAGFCVGASGSNSEIRAYFSNGSKFEIGSKQFNLNSGIHCFCSSQSTRRILNWFGFTPRIRHRGITSINGNIDIAPGELDLDLFK
jgi:endo-1,4-beta-mannosidase